MSNYYEKYNICQAIEDIEDLQNFIDQDSEGIENEDLSNELENYKGRLMTRLELMDGRA